jgi:hypothetical protein
MVSQRHINLSAAWKLMRALLALAIATVAWSGKANTLTAIGNKTTCPGDTVTFTTTAAGPTPWQFIWQKNGVTISGQTTNHLTLTNVTSAAKTFSFSLEGGAEWQDVGSYVHRNHATRESAVLDLSQAAFFTFGVGYSF